MKSLALSLVAALIISSPAAAQEIQLLPEGQTLIALSVTERMSVPQDTLHASLRIESTDKDAKTLQKRINQAMEKAIATAKGIKSVKTSTGYYSVYQYNASGSAREDQQWRGSQSIELESTDSEALLTLAGDIQEMGFVMNNLNYSLSTEKADEVRDSMMEAAIARAREKADRAAKALGKSNVDIAMVNVDSSTSFPAPVMMMKARGMATMESADMSAPSAEAGESEVTLTATIHAIAK
jgi:predicted secreted protein